MKTKVQKLVNNKNTTMAWVMLFWCLYCQLQVYLLRTQLNIYDGAVFSIQWTKANIFNWVLNTPLKVWPNFTFITWLDLAGLLEKFLPVSWAHLFRYFKNSFWKKIQTIWCLKLTGHILEILGSVLYWPERALFYEKGHFLLKKIISLPNPSIQSIF